MTENVRRVEEFFEKAGLKPRPKQLEVASQLAELLDGSAALEAPVGFGKTLTALAAFYARDEFPIQWRVRSYDIARHIAKNVALADLTYYIAGGRERLCPLYGEHRSDIHVFCRYFRYKCPHFKPLARALPTAYEFEDLAKVKETCPYYLQLFFVNRDVVITPYKLGLSFNVNATVIDEAHNLIDIQSIPLVKLKAALHELSMGDLIGHEFDPRRLYELAMPKLLDLLERGEKPLTATVLTKLARATLGWVEENEVYLLSFYRPRYKTLYISATLGPLAPLLHVPVVRVEGLKIPAVIATWVTTRFRDFDVAMAHRYNDIIFLMRKYFRRIVVFASSRVASLLTYDYAGEDLPSARDWEGVLLLYSRGKRGEGVDIEADAVLIAGASYLPPVVKLSRLGISHDDLTAIVTMQNVGRTIRSPSSRPFVVLGDERFSERLRRHIEQYFQLQEANDIQELDKALKQWHQQNSQQQTNQK